MSAGHPVLDFFRTTNWGEFAWVIVGLVGQFLFASRFIVQWIASEKVKRSVVPETFWYLSLGGGAMLLLYAIWRVDPVFILGQALGLAVYLRNIVLIRRNGRGTD